MFLLPMDPIGCLLFIQVHRLMWRCNFSFLSCNWIIRVWRPLFSILSALLSFSLKVVACTLLKCCSASFGLSGSKILFVGAWSSFCLRLLRLCIASFKSLSSWVDRLDSSINFDEVMLSCKESPWMVCDFSANSASCCASFCNSDSFSFTTGR